MLDCSRGGSKEDCLLITVFTPQVLELLVACRDGDLDRVKLGIDNGGPLQLFRVRALPDDSPSVPIAASATLPCNSLGGSFGSSNRLCARKDRDYRYLKSPHSRRRACGLRRSAWQSAAAMSTLLSTFSRPEPIQMRFISQI